MARKPKRSVYHVVPDKVSGKWKLKKQGSDRALKAFDKKQDAINRGKEIAKKQPLGQLKVHKTDGTIQTEYSYGSDPKKSKG